jgi:hypothetical protein
VPYDGRGDVVELVLEELVADESAVVAVGSLAGLWQMEALRFVSCEIKASVLAFLISVFEVGEALALVPEIVDLVI